VTPFESSREADKREGNSCDAKAVSEGMMGVLWRSKAALTNAPVAS
jgi:hypothetical protein